MEKNKNLLSEEHLRKIKHRADYRINESPRYRALVNDNEEFDTIPDQNFQNRVGQGGNFNRMVSEVGEEEDAELAQQKDVREPTTAPEPEVGDEEGEAPEAPAPAYADDEGEGMPPAEAGIEPEPDVNEIQNEIIKHNIEAMKSIQTNLETLNNTVSSLNAKLGQLNAEVEEVREPTNVEKLTSKKDVSYPYYFNLNDFWKDNWFNQRREETNERGIRELPDGSYIADFDDLPTPSKHDIQKSFNKIV